MTNPLPQWIASLRARFAPALPALPPNSTTEKRRSALARLQRRARQLLLVEDVYVFSLVINGLIVVGLGAGWLLSPGRPILPSGAALDPWVADLSPSTLLWSLGWVPGSWLYEQARKVRNRRRWNRAAQLALATGDHRAKELVLLSLSAR